MTSLKFIFISVFFCALGFYALPSQAEQGNDPFHVTGYDLPRFAALSSNKVYMRSGPGTKYPVKWEYHKKYLPVEIILEFDVWRKVRDYDGEQGWVHQSLLTGRRFGITSNDQISLLKSKPDETSLTLVKIEPESWGEIESCATGWCKVEFSGYSGWIEQKSLWGVYEGEEFN